MDHFPYPSGWENPGYIKPEIREHEFQGVSEIYRRRPTGIDNLPHPLGRDNSHVSYEGPARQARNRGSMSSPVRCSTKPQRGSTPSDDVKREHGQSDSDGEGGQYGYTPLDRGTRRQEPSIIPRGLFFDGTGKWKTFYTKFNSFAIEANWSQYERRRRLC